VDGACGSKPQQALLLDMLQGSLKKSISAPVARSCAPMRHLVLLGSSLPRAWNARRTHLQGSGHLGQTLPDIHPPHRCLLELFRELSSNLHCKVIEFDGLCQIRSPHLILANRIASLSVASWRIFASFHEWSLPERTPGSATCDWRSRKISSATSGDVCICLHATAEDEDKD